MRFLRNKPLVLTIIILLLIVALPVLLLAQSRSTESRSEASASTTLYFNPKTTTTSPLVKNVGDNFSLGLRINPGSNLVNFLKLEILYDPSKIKLNNQKPVQVNAAAFKVKDGPIYISGKVSIILDIGPDPTKVITTDTRVLTLNFRATKTARSTQVSFSPSTQVFSIGAEDGFNENVLSTTMPATIKVK